MNIDPLNEATWAFLHKANELSIPIEPLLWSNLKHCLRPAITKYLETLIESESNESQSS